MVVDIPNGTWPAADAVPVAVAVAQLVRLAAADGRPEILIVAVAEVELGRGLGERLGGVRVRGVGHLELPPAFGGGRNTESEDGKGAQREESNAAEGRRQKRPVRRGGMRRLLQVSEQRIHPRYLR